MIKLVFADNQPIFQAGIRAVLSAVPDIEIVGEADNSIDVQQLVGQLRPQILLLDLNLAGPPMVEVIRGVRASLPEIAILILTAHVHDAYLARMMEAGVAGLLNKNVPVERLVEAIRRAAQGEILFDQKQLRRAEQWRQEAGEKWASLSKHQEQILGLLAQGITKAEVANRLEISPRLVDYHIGKFLKKLKFKSLLDTVNWVHKYFPEKSGSITG